MVHDGRGGVSAARLVALCLPGAADWNLLVVRVCVDNERAPTTGGAIKRSAAAGV
jgi:hypothetical protein